MPKARLLVVDELGRAGRRGGIQAPVPDRDQRVRAAERDFYTTSIEFSGWGRVSVIRTWPPR